eukprot:TRINITY_DN56362_c0_g1_i1.p1 TRINITY_DN56362_c0_g1~~TRINITY_DN56362_c0_g1_i1.p1  ORF type:complete len:509 (-),score=91.88 TRINITY_DN56362_c0_g1_i1:105-1631(-)
MHLLSLMNHLCVLVLLDFASAAEQCLGRGTSCPAKSRHGAALLQRESTPSVGHIDLRSEDDSSTETETENMRLVQLASDVHDLGRLALDRLVTSSKVMELVEVMSGNTLRRDQHASSNAANIMNLSQSLDDLETELSHFRSQGNYSADEAKKDDPNPSLDELLTRVIDKVKSMKARLEKLESKQSSKGNSTISGKTESSDVSDTPPGRIPVRIIDGEEGDEIASGGTEDDSSSQIPLDADVPPADDVRNEMPLLQSDAVSIDSPVDSDEFQYANTSSWGEQFPGCAKGRQSPININTAEADRSAPPSTMLKYVKFSPQTDRLLKNTGHVAKVEGQFGKLALPDGEYSMEDFHFHFPSEHTVNGTLAVGEMHMVHVRIGMDGKKTIAVIAVLLDLFDGDVEVGFFESLKFDQSMPTKAGESTSVGTVDLAALSSLLNGGFFHYVGSTTTPPCVENVHWYVLKKHGFLSASQAQAAKAMFPAGNNRPTQSLDGRVIREDQLASPNEFDFE